MKLCISKILLPVVFVVTTTARADFEAKHRTDFNVVLNADKISQRNLEFFNREDIAKKIFLQHGVLIDDKSKVWIRGEEKQVELNCFDCLLIDSDNSSTYDRMPINEEHKNDF